ncbi:MAG: pilus assembly protein [Acidimicrobiia bacterium]|nr:pilus assembly protein [Acidimicrobiia bacterium]
MKRIRRRRRDEGGAALVEFAIIAPLLLLLVLGIIEFGWLLGNTLDVRHGAREAARQAAVNAGTVGAMATTACDAMDFSTGQIITFTDGATGKVGDTATVAVVMPYNSLTNFMNAFMPANINTQVEIRLEQDSSNWSTGAAPACP